MTNLTQEHLIETTAGSCYAVEIGSRKPSLIFVHGGPGLSHSYLMPSFLELASLARLCFFDQPGCGQSANLHKSITSNATVEASACCINTLAARSDYILIGHSWGSYIIARLLSQKCLLDPLPKSLLLLSPAPLSRSLYDSAGTRLIERIPVEIMQKIQELVKLKTPAAGHEIMHLALPYYCGRSENLPGLDFQYSIATYNSVADSLPDFDYNNLILKFPPTTIVFGKEDYIGPDLFPAIDNAPNIDVQFISGGHFAFAEPNSAIFQIISSLLRRITQ